MASDDVIELGSSDEDTEPAPKRRKPPPNTMVHIPGKLKGITITPAKSKTKINPVCISKGAIGKSVTVTKVPKNNVNPYSNMNKLNGKPVKAIRQPPVNQTIKYPSNKNVAIPISGLPVLNAPASFKNVVNPLNNTGIKSFPTNKKVNTINVASVNTINMMKVNTQSTKPVKGSTSVKNISYLPPGITVKRMGTMGTSGAKKPKILPSTIVKMSKPSVITTVDLDDDDEPDTSSASGPQWYMRPEDEKGSPKKTQEKHEDTLGDDASEDEMVMKTKLQSLPEKSTEKSPDKVLKKSPSASEPSVLEQENNKEPDKSKFIEITIEDSPLKPEHNKKGFKVGAELAIIIEDSPVKNTTDKPISSCSSDDEKTASPKDPHSKKKLKYPNAIQTVETIEIEFEPLPAEKSTNVKECEIEKTKIQHIKANITEKAVTENSTVKTTTENTTKVVKRKTVMPKMVTECSEIVEIEESPVKPPETEQTRTPQKNNPTKPVKMIEIETVVLDDKEKDEFHPIYQSFINLCFQLENSEDMKKIVEKKIKSYYRQVPKKYTESEAFIDMVSSKIMAIKAGPEKMYLYIKDVVDELNLQRKLAKAQVPVKETKNEEQEKFLYGEESEFDSKRQRQIRKLEKTLKKLHRAIQKLEEQEVDFDDEEDSVYLLTESEDVTSSKDDKPLDKAVLLQRYKERMVRVHAKLCQLTNTKMPSEARVQIDARPGQPKGPAKRLEKWINRKIPIGTPLPFPDFHDVLRCVREANQEDKLGWNEADIMEEARDLFTRCGKKLQRRRQENEWRLAASRIPVDVVDPAEDSAELKRKLEDNKRAAAKRETEVLNKYADRQNQLNLEAVEIGDKEAEESPVESDDEETVEDNASLSSKQKRKERLKRLLQEKSKKVSDEKDNMPENSPVEVVTPLTEDGVTQEMSNETEISIKSTDEKAKEMSNEIEISIKSTDEKEDSEHKNEDLESKLLNKDPLNLPKKDKDIVESNSSSKNKEDNENQSDKVHSLSDDSNKVESDIDELHLLQKLYSENELNTSVMDSDSGTPIAISDSSSSNERSSDERRNKKSLSDVISIENSSYSESEEKKGKFCKDSETDSALTKDAIKETVDTDMEIECSNNGVDKKSNRFNSKENRQSLEDILNTSSDEVEDTEVCKDNRPTVDPNMETCINLRDDSISIGETIIEENQKRSNASEDELISDNSEKNANTDASSVEGMEIGPDQHSQQQNILEEIIVETACCQSTDEGSITEITSIKSTDPNEEENVIETTSLNSVETIEDGNSNESANINSVETIEEQNSNETANINSAETTKIANIEATSIQSIETIEDGNSNKKTISLKSFESVEAVNDNVTLSITPIKPIEDGNDKETTNVKPVESVVDRKVNEMVTIKSVEKNVNETNKSEKTTKNGDATENIVNSTNENKVPMDTSENNDDDDITVEKTRQNNNLLPEPMEVDSNV